LDVSARVNPWLRRLLVLVAVLIVLKLLVPSLERRLVFFPFAGEDASPETLGIPYRPVTLTTSDGERLVLWQLEPERPIADVVYFHGNGGNLSVWLPVLAGLHRQHIRVLAVDYRGYGLSTGAPSEEGVLRDADTVVRYAHDRRRQGRPLVYWGRSLGGAIAAYATSVASPDGLILESSFPDKASVVRNQPVLRALNVLSSYRFPTLEWLRGFDKPVLVMHGDRDSIVPFALGRELFEGLGGPKTFVAIRGADHNDGFDVTNRDYWDPVLTFIERLAHAEASGR
jgi:hypothetical protein